MRKSFVAKTNSVAKVLSKGLGRITELTIVREKIYTPINALKVIPLAVKPLNVSQWKVCKWIISLMLWTVSGLALAANSLPETEAKRLAQQHYATQGEWAGKFRIARFLKTRFEVAETDAAKVHFQYEWALLQDPTRTGIDNRYFVYRKVNNGWQVVEMGQHQSGRF